MAGTGPVSDRQAGEQHLVNCQCKIGVVQMDLDRGAFWELCAWAGAGPYCFWRATAC